MCQAQVIPKETSNDQRHASAKNHPFVVIIVAFLVPSLFYQLTNVIPIYLTSILRIVFIHILLSVHYVIYDKDNYDNKISQKQIVREKNDYLIASILHMYAQLSLQLLFPGMFFVDDAKFMACLYSTFITHIFIVEPLYYFVHRWLHIPSQMKAMHGFHHMSVNPIPSTSLVQNFEEHFVYIATFGPAMIFPYLINGYQHWAVIMIYLVWFDLVNAYGHTNIKCRHWIWDHPYSPLKYLIYTPEFHLGHHFYFNSNFGLFMPIWDHLFNTYKPYKKVENLIAQDKLDFVFIGHNGGLGHFLTIPEYCFYNMYDPYLSTGLPMEIEFLIIDAIVKFFKLFMPMYNVSKYCINNHFIGRISVLMRTPIDYLTKSKYPAINNDIIQLIKSNHKQYGTRYFGLGNLNKMKQLNNGGEDIVTLINNDDYLKNKNIRIWTGDTLTAGSVYYQILKIKNLKKLFYIGANGKIGKAICQLLSSSKHNIQICIYTNSNYKPIQNDNITYTNNINDIINYQHVVLGKMYRSQFYKKVYNKFAKNSYLADHNIVLPKTVYLLDYTAPFIPLFGATKSNQNILSVHSKMNISSIKHIQIGLLKVKNNSEFLKGYFDICMGTDQNHIYPCHAGCIIRTAEKMEENEVGEIDLKAIDSMWSKAIQYGFTNNEIEVNDV